MAEATRPAGRCQTAGNNSLYPQDSRSLEGAWADTSSAGHSVFATARHPNFEGFKFDFSSSTLVEPEGPESEDTRYCQRRAPEARGQHQSVSTGRVDPSPSSNQNSSPELLNFRASPLKTKSIKVPRTGPHLHAVASNVEEDDSCASAQPRSAKRVIRPDTFWRKDLVESSQQVHPSQSDPGATAGPQPSELPNLIASSKTEDTSLENPCRSTRLDRKPLDPSNPLVPAPLKLKSKFVVRREPKEICERKFPIDSEIAHHRRETHFKLFGEYPEEEPVRPEPDFQISSKDVPRLRREWIHEALLPEEDLEEISHFDCEGLQNSEDPPRSSPKMSFLHPESAAVMTEHRREAVRLAQAQEKSVIEKCKRSGQEAPGYTFDELIGKGSFGRVYKGRHKSTNQVVAIKVIDVDEADFHVFGDAKDEQIRDFNREIRILRQAKESEAPNLNQMIEALPVHSQLWLVCDYCPGGSVKTLMRATGDRLSEKYIVVVARELAKALKGLHDAGIMHRDVKAANVLVHEEGRLELCDFGVAGVLEQRTDKRRTFIGTLHWMPPELWSDEPEYSDEVDVWEYGVTIYECAIGKPPNADLRERQQLKSRMRRLKHPIGLPEHEHFSDALRSLVEYTLSPDAKTRPSMKDVLEHAYIADTEETHPTKSLVQLVQVYYQWLHSGGQRVSLFMPGGAVVSEIDEAVIDPVDEWNFSTTDGFEKRNSVLLEIPTLSELSPGSQTEGEETPRGPKQITLSPPPPREMTNVERQIFEARVKRGAGLSNLFDQDKPDYEYKVKKDFIPIVEQRRVSDLPFRAMGDDRPSSIASNVIDLGDFNASDYAVLAPKRDETIQLADAATIRAKRADSRGPRDPSASASLTARRTSSADDLSQQQVSAQDFAFNSKESIGADTDGSALLEPASQSASVRDPSRKTMEWTFATAMPKSPERDEDEALWASKATSEKAAKHATLEWSFSNAMAEAEAASAVESRVSPPTRTIATRPAALLRTMTQPVTSSEVYNAEEGPPRPSTSHSEAPSEMSFSSADIDPFALDNGQPFPDPESTDDLMPSAMYASRGQTLAPEHIVAYTSTQPGPQPYILGRSARIGEEGFPGPGAGPTYPSGIPMSHPRRGMRSIDYQEGTAKANQHPSTLSRSSEEDDVGIRGRAPFRRPPTVDLPAATPPSTASMSSHAPADLVEGELSRLLTNMQQSLAGAAQVLGSLGRSGIRRKNRGKGKAKAETTSPVVTTTTSEEDEWEDEE